MTDYKILSAGESGYGYLIEHDGHICPKDERNKDFINEVHKIGEGGIPIVEPLVVTVVLQKYGVKNNNKRIYPEHILRKQAEVYNEVIKNNGAIGELDHPETSIISGDRVSHIIRKIWWEGKTLMGEMEIIMSPGFIKSGIISCKGDLVANYLRLGIRIGVSSRGLGSLEPDHEGTLIVQDDFAFICWDVVTAPSTPGSWIFKNAKDAKPFVESENKRKNLLEGGLDKFLLGD